MDTEALPPERLAVLRDEAQPTSAGYSLVSWAGPTPDQHLDQVAALNRVGFDAPHDPSRQELACDAAWSGRPTSGRGCTACSRTS